MQARVRDQINAAAELRFELLLERTDVQETPVRVHLDEQVEVTRLRGLPAARRAKHTHIADAVLGGNLQYVVAPMANNLAGLHRHGNTPSSRSSTHSSDSTHRATRVTRTGLLEPGRFAFFAVVGESRDRTQNGPERMLRAATGVPSARNIEPASGAVADADDIGGRSRLDRDGRRAMIDVWAIGLVALMIRDTDRLTDSLEDRQLLEINDGAE